VNAILANELNLILGFIVIFIYQVIRDQADVNDVIDWNY